MASSFSGPDVVLASHVRSGENVLDAPERVLDSMSTAMYVCDRNGFIRRFNRRAAELWGRAPRLGDPTERFCGSYRLFRLDGGPLPHSECPMADALRTGFAIRDQEVVIERPDGSRVIAAVSIDPIKDTAGHVVGAVNCFHDITDRKRRERELHDHARKLRKSLDALPAAVYITDAVGRITYYNDAAVALAGREPTLGSDEWCVTWKLYRPDGSPLPHDECPMAIALKENRPVRGMEAIAERPDGAQVPFIPYPTPIYDESGALAGAVNMLVDITEHKQAEEALKQADRRKDEFLAMLAHELRNPLAPIRNAAAILNSENVSPEALRQVSELIERQSTQLAHLVDDLLDVARIARGTISLQRKTVSVAAAIERAIEATRPLIRLKEQEIRFTPAPIPLYVDADLTRLCQIVANLLSNAAKYSPERSAIYVSLSSEHERASIRVRDEGIGIDAATLPHVFDLFTQADRSLDHSMGGLGIGLNVVKRLVELHGGQVEANSAGLDRGSEFVVRIPLVRAPDTVAPAPTGDSRSTTISRRVLIVEDNRDTAESLLMLLDLEGHEALTVSDGRSALDTLASFEPDLILIDIGLPDMDGYALAKSMRQIEKRAVALYALTGYGSERDRALATQAGFDGYLTKPCDPKALLSLVQATARESRSQWETRNRGV